MGVKAVIFREEMSRHFFNMSAATFVKVLVLAAVAGAITWVASIGLDRYVLTPIFCNGAENIAICTNSTLVASNIALVLVAIMVVPLLATLYMKRSLLVVAAAVISLWGMVAWVAGYWYISLLWTIAVFVAVYAALVWLNRLRDDLPAIFFIVLFVVLARVVLLL